MNKGTIQIKTSSQMELVDITGKIQQELQSSGIEDGICIVYNPHTTAGLTINEGADPAVQSDILGALKKIVPLDYPYRHMEGNSPAHVMTSLIGSSVTIFVNNGKLQLGTWQKIFFCEFDGPRTRKVLWQIR
ncbi:MAG: secondary thiamine-phosphate synthase enzyme YjbQ [Proteobacteria bacterium]|nr:secondary thiamine-phosphate synthase enzyme YjbQ [Pseudomonadota bacterium]MBU1708593.1 secondary thiamine-phosphate synthase enzyme YjbQ [Pseudomonadota bacterium]